MWKCYVKYKGSLTLPVESWVWPNLNVLIDLTITPTIALAVGTYSTCKAMDIVLR